MGGVGQSPGCHCLSGSNTTRNSQAGSVVCGKEIPHKKKRPVGAETFLAKILPKEKRCGTWLGLENTVCTRRHALSVDMVKYRTGH